MFVTFGLEYIEFIAAPRRGKSLQPLERSGLTAGLATRYQLLL